MSTSRALSRLTINLFCTSVFFAIFGLLHSSHAHRCFADESFKAGASIVDVSPIQFPVAVNGGMTANTATKINSPLNARAIVLSQAGTTIAIVVVDSCMMPRPLLDEIKGMAARKTGIPADHITVAATHTHTAAASMSCLGTDADPQYVAYLRIKVVEAIEQAQANLQPAKVGWGSFDASNYMAIRRWIRRPDRIATDPFGNATVRANMHAGRNWDDVTGESGPEDPELSMISFQTLDGAPIALLANLSMHYFSGVQPISADYFGIYCDTIQQKLQQQHPSALNPPVAIMSHGCSGDVWRTDYTKQTPERFETIKIDQYSQELVDQSLATYKKITYTVPETLAMAERRLRLNYRTPNKQLLEWSEQITEGLNGNLPKTTEEVYAREQLYLAEAGSTDVVVQALRIGDIAIATTPTETYAITGLKIKHQSPLEKTMVFDLANGGDGYIPPPEQHVLGGYNTWAARSAGLEIQAEPKMVAAILELLESVTGQARKPSELSVGSAASELLARNPLAYWRLNEFTGPRAVDSSEHARDGYFEPGVVFFLEGPNSEAYCQPGDVNRSAHFAGGRMLGRVGKLPPRYEISMWIWNGMPDESREVLGWFYGRGTNNSLPDGCEQVGLSGVGADSGKLLVQVGGGETKVGKTKIPRWTWQKVTLVRDTEEIQVFLGEAKEAEIRMQITEKAPDWANEMYFGGSCTNEDNWEGRLDEIAIFAKP